MPTTLPNLALPTEPADIATFVEALMERNRALYGGYLMELDDDQGDDADDDSQAGDDASDSGNDADSDDDSGDDSDTGDDESDDGADSLGDAGKQALARMKAKLKTERTRRREAESKLADKDGDGDGDGDGAKTAAAIAKANARIIKSEVKAAAKGVLADPSDAYKFLDLDSFEVDDDGNVDEDEIADAIEDLVKNKPYLAAQGGRRFKGGAGGGARKETRPKQLTRADLAGMTPAEIDKAHKEGRLADLLQSNKQ